MDAVDKSQSSQDDEKEAEDDIVGCMEIDDADAMNEVADILLHLNVSAQVAPLPPPSPCGRDRLIAHEASS